MSIERLSIELTNRCDKGCGFCYNHSGPHGDTLWRVEEILALVRDCVNHGVKAVSFGGGEPLLYPGLGDVLQALQGQVFRSVTTNGLLLTQAEHFARLLAARPDKVHLSIHRPGSLAEVSRVIATVQELQAAGIASGVNLLVPADQVEGASHAAQMLRAAGIDNQRIVYLPQRGSNTPTAKAVAAVAAGPFQSMSCLTACASSPRFCSISWDRAVAWCSYTSMKRRLPELSYAGLMAALAGWALSIAPHLLRWNTSRWSGGTRPCKFQISRRNKMTFPAQVDYPAAHSMDSYWFAVDDTGEVALMATEETGPAPKGAPHSDGMFEFFAYFDKDSNGIPVFPFGQDLFPEGLSTRELESIFANLPESERKGLEQMALRTDLSLEERRNFKTSLIKGFGSFVVLFADSADVKEFEVKELGNIVRLDPLRPLFHVMRGAWVDVLLLLLKGRVLAWRKLAFDVYDWEDTASFYGIHVFTAPRTSGREYFEQSMCSPATPTEYERVNTPKQPRIGLPGNVMGTQANGDRPDKKIFFSSLAGVRFSTQEFIQIADIVPSVAWGLGYLLPNSGDSVIRRNMIVVHEADAIERDRCVAEWSQAAAQGDLVAQYTLAYFYSQKTSPDHEKAFAAYRQAAEQAEAAPPSSEDMFENGSAAQCCLADLHERGVGTLQDDGQALHWYTRSATKGNRVAQYRLGMRYKNGRGVAADNVQARFWLAQSAKQDYEEAEQVLWNFPNFEGAEQSDQAAQYELAQMHAQGGRGVEKDPARARHWYTQSALQGNVSAQYELGKIYMSDSTVTPDLAQARHWLAKAAAQGNGDAQGLFNETDVWLAAEQKNTKAMHALAYLYQRWKNYSHAVYWYRKVIAKCAWATSPSLDMVENGSAAQCNLAQIYANGQGVPQDDLQALYWFRKSVALNNPVAQYRLGMLYLDGKGVPKDTAQARVLLAKSAKQGCRDAQSALQELARLA